MSRSKLQIGALALAVAALMALGVVVASQALSWDTPFAGFLVYRSGAVASLWRADWAGRRAGLRVRDVILAVDGEPLARAGRSAAGRAAAALDARAARRASRSRCAIPTARDAHVHGAAVAADQVGSRLDVPAAVLDRPRLSAPRRDHLSIQARRAKRRWRARSVSSPPRSICRCSTRTPPIASRACGCRIRCSARCRCTCSRSSPRCGRAGRDGACSCRCTASAARWWRGGSGRSPIRAMSDTASLTSAVLLALEFAVDLGLLALHDDARRVAGGAQPRQVDLRRAGAHLHDGGGVAVRVARRLVVGAPDGGRGDGAVGAVPGAHRLRDPEAQPLRPRRGACARRWCYAVATALVLGVYFAAVAVASHFATILVGQSFARGADAGGGGRVPSAAQGRAAHRRQAALSRQPHAGAARAVCARCRRWRTCRRWPRWRSDRCSKLTRARGVDAAGAVAARAARGRGQRGRVEADDPTAIRALPLSAARSKRRSSAIRVPQAVRDLGEEAAAERAALGALGVELLVPLVGRGRLDGVVAFTAPRGGVYGYRRACTRSRTPRRSWRWRWRTRRWWPSARCASDWRRSGSWRR